MRRNWQSVQSGWILSAPLLFTLAAAAPAGCSGDPAPSAGAGGAGGEGAGATTSSVPSTGAMGGSSCGLEGAKPLGFQPSQRCAACHQAIYYDWVSSMHARSVTSPVMIAQANQAYEIELSQQGSPDPQRFCVTCHSPLLTRFAPQATLPFKGETCDAPIVPQEGIGCVTCHAYRGEPSSSKAATSAVFADLDESGGYVGPIADPVPSNAHESEGTPLFSSTPEKLCLGCHDVALDIDKNGKIEKGKDFILASTGAEHDAYVKKGGQESCLGCHMPVKPGVTRAAEASGIDTPPRAVHDHSFVGVDYHLDEVAINDPQKEAREALLKDAAKLTLTSGALQGGGDLSFEVAVTNVKAGHNLPTGFTFLRQMWLDVRVLDGNQQKLIASGELRTPSDDLCDVTSMSDVMQFFVHGCLASDPQLVNFQTQLVDRIDVRKDSNGDPVLDGSGELIPVKDLKGVEMWAQRLSGGVVPRTRPLDKQELAPLGPGETRTFGYSFQLAPQPAAVTVEVHLWFRNLPPYFLRKLAAGQPPGEVNLALYLKDIQTIEIASAAVTIPVTP